MSYYIRFADGTYFAGFNRRKSPFAAAIKLPIEIALDILAKANDSGPECKIVVGQI
jgi:hypothetical protein